jgi:electron transfer flavoprotein alpha subunit
MTERKSVLTIGEMNNGRLAAITGELLGGGRQLATELGGELNCLLIGSDTSTVAQEAITLGADKVYVVDDPLLENYQTETFAQVAEKVVKMITPDILLIGHTDTGRDLAPRLAFNLRAALTTDTVAIAINPKSRQLRCTKPIFGGNAMAVFSSNFSPQIASIRPKSMCVLDRDDTRSGEIINVNAELDPAGLKTLLLERVVEESEGLRLEDAEVVVAGGRGIGSAEGFKQLEEIAGLLKGAVGATRPACDNGWIPAGQQIGLTGKIIAPRLYFAIGISGSSQHMTGISGGTIVAVNNDAEANIFRGANYGVVADYRKVLPAFTAALKDLICSA